MEISRCRIFSYLEILICFVRVYVVVYIKYICISKYMFESFGWISG